MISNILLTIVAACLFAEFAGYWLHVLMHSERIEFLSRNHMIHHLIIYAPDKPQRPSRDYLNSTYGRASILGLGMEWIVPVAVMLAFTLGGMGVLRVRALPQAIFIATALAWGYAMFWYMHDAMHLKGFWMERSRWLGKWFLGIRRLHDIHHMRLDDAGRMPTNFGICFLLFDRIFGTLAVEHGQFNRLGREAARNRYAFIFPPCQPPTGMGSDDQDEAEEYQDTGVVD